MQGGYPPGQSPYAPPGGAPSPMGGAYPGAPHPGTPLATPGAPFGVHPTLGVPYSDKSKLVAGLLQLLIPAFAVGRFYTGHTGLAVAQLLVTWLTCGAGMLWPLIDGIILLTTDSTDSDGRLLK